MLMVILSITAVICYVVMAATYGSQSKYKNGMLFAVTLPEHAMEHPEVARIRGAFRRRMIRTSAWMLAAYIPFIALHSWAAYQMIYYLVWLSVFMVVMVLPFRQAFRDTLALKRDQDWFTGAKRVITGDLRVAQLKNSRSAPLWLFAVPFAMSASLLYWAGQKDPGLYGIASAGLAMTALFFLISLVLRRTKARVYSSDSDTNLALNQSRRRAVSYLWLTVAIVENVLFFLILLLVMNENDAMNGVWLTLIALFTVLPVGLVVCAYRRIGKREREILANEGQTIHTDEDEYWANGFTYHNPNDRSVMVTKRVGIGETVNTGTTAGKIIVGVTLGLVAAVILATSFMLVRSELTAPRLTLTSDSRVEIAYPMYSFDFSLKDVRELTLTETVPSGMKTNGEATDRYARGHFRLNDIGKTRLYIFKDNPPYIRFQLEDVYIFYNEENPGMTRRLFEELEERKHQADVP